MLSISHVSVTCPDATFPGERSSCCGGDGFSTRCFQLPRAIMTETTGTADAERRHGAHAYRKIGTPTLSEAALFREEKLRVELNPLETPALGETG